MLAVLAAVDVAEAVVLLAVVLVAVVLVVVPVLGRLPVVIPVHL